MCECFREKKPFLKRYGTYEFLVMPLGIMKAPSTFQRMMDEVLRGLGFVCVYLDDVFVFLRTLAEHIEHLRVAIMRIVHHRVLVRAVQCEAVGARGKTDWSTRLPRKDRGHQGLSDAQQCDGASKPLGNCQIVTEVYQRVIQDLCSASRLNISKEEAIHLDLG